MFQSLYNSYVGPPQLIPDFDHELLAKRTSNDLSSLHIHSCCLTNTRSFLLRNRYHFWRFQTSIQKWTVERIHEISFLSEYFSIQRTYRNF